MIKATAVLVGRNFRLDGSILFKYLVCPNFKHSARLEILDDGVMEMFDCKGYTAEEINAILELVGSDVERRLKAMAESLGASDSDFALAA